jgi:hypothetical protein
MKNICAKKQNSGNFHCHPPPPLPNQRTSLNNFDPFWHGMQSSVCSSRGNVTDRLIKSAKPSSQAKLPLFVALYEYRKAYQLAPLS